MLSTVEIITNHHSLLLLTLDRLLKEKFLLWANLICNNEIKFKKKYNHGNHDELKKWITKHNDLLVDDLHLSGEESIKGHKDEKSPPITRIYGIVDYKPGRTNPWHGVSIQEFIAGNCDENYKGSLSNYFYKKLNEVVCSFYLKEKKNRVALPKINTRYRTLFKLALPSEKVRSWEEFYGCEEVKVVFSEISKRVAEKEESLNQYTEFKSLYYSASNREIEYFTLKISKNPIYDEGLKINRGIGKIKFNENGSKYSGEVTRSDNKVKIELLSEKDKTKRGLIFLFIPNAHLFEEINYMQGIYLGDSVRKPGRTFSYEFISAKKDFLADEDNYARIVTTLLLRRNGFEVESHELLKSQLDKRFLDNNLISDDLRMVINDIKKYGMVFLNYGKRGNILLSKIKFDENFKSTLFVPKPEVDFNGDRTVKIVEHECNLSARNKDNNIIATTYYQDHLSNITTINFQKPNGNIFVGAITHHNGGDIFASYVVAILDPSNKSIEPREFLLEKDKNEIDGLIDKIDCYRDAIRKLEVLRDDTIKHLQRGQNNQAAKK